MNRAGLKKIMDSPDLTPGEKKYILDWQYHMGGSFSQALFMAIDRADEHNLRRLELGFPEEVHSFKAWSRGALRERASRIAGGDGGVIMDKEETPDTPPSKT